MEAVGVVLGGLPLALYAIENYHRCLQLGKDYWRFDSTIKLIRNHVFIQQEQLYMTLRGIGLVNPTRDELEEHLRQIYPERCDTFMDVIEHMEKLLAKLMDKLDIDAQGKPRWTKETPERAAWEWRRVRRSFGRSSRQTLISELQFWNDRLSLCLEKSELPLGSDAPSSALEAVRSRFNARSCDAIRLHARDVYVAVSRSWKCQSHDHRGNLKLSWHIDGWADPAKLSLAFPSSPSLSESWRELSVEAVQEASNLSNNSQQASLLPPPPSSTPDSLLPPPRKRFKSWFQPQSREIEMNDVTERTPSPSLDQPVPVPDIDCLCAFLHEGQLRGRLARGQDGSNPQTLRIEQRPSSSAQVRDMPLRRLLTPGQAVRGPASFSVLARKDRFAIAAAATWAVLYLAGTPWISPEWTGKEIIHLLVEDGPSVARHFPTLSHVFGPSRSDQHNPAAGSRATQQEQALVPGFIRNKTLFTLGVLLIELCLNKSFEQLRQENQRDSFAASLGVTTTHSDYEIADAHMQSVYLEAGDFYGYAVQRCLRCEFPGRDVTKSFEFEQFRRDFFSYVVAPVQATFALLPSSCTSL